jgi:hypothetical protein
MDMSDAQKRHQIIRSTMAQQPEDAADRSIHLWELLAARLTSLIGDIGFNSLFTRSLDLTGIQFPWLIVNHSLQTTESRFADLKVNFGNHSAAEASEASQMLLIIFTDILAALIGESLTIQILNSAWSTDVSAKEGKEPQ